MTPFTQTDVLPLTEPLITDVANHYPLMTRSAVITMLERERSETRYFLNDLYQVAVTLEEHDGRDWYHLNIRRRDGRVIRRDWRQFQQIKNELIGPEHEGAELYPAENRLVDTSNKYHIYVATDPAYRFPFGWRHRDVSNDPGSTNGTRQRPR